MKTLLVSLLFVTYTALFVAGAESHPGKFHRRRHNIHNRSSINTTTDHVERRATNAKFSWYDTEESGNPGSCGKHIKNSEFVVAMNQHEYKQSDCFKTITITFEGRSTQATIGDKCPKCPPGGLDLSKGLFEHVAPKGDGVVYGSWIWGGSPSQTPKEEEKSQPPPPKPKTTTTTTTTRSKMTPTPTPTPTPATTSTTTTRSAIETSSGSALPAGHPSNAGNLGNIYNFVVVLGAIVVEAARVNQE